MSSSQEKIEQIVRKFVDDFSQHLDDEAAAKSIANTCSPSIIWSDHAFTIQRQGHTAVLGLKKAFTHCNQPFHTEIKKLHVVPGGAIIEAVWVGCCKNDIVRPDGQVAVKANGRDFVSAVCFCMEVDPVEGIRRIDEYYSKPWWDAIPVEEYTKVTGASMKT